MRIEAFDALYVTGALAIYANMSQIAELAQQYRLPTIAEHPEFARNGCLLSYGDDLPRNVVRGAEYVDKILRGAKPSDLPIEQPARFDLIINLKTARVLGLEIPSPLFARADEIIE